MKINIGSLNPTKIKAAENIFKLYLQYKNADIRGTEVNIEEFGHPKSLIATVQGAKDRAKQAYSDCDFSLGIEGGLIEVPGTKTGYMETAVCAIYDGRSFYLGLSPAFEWPKKVLDLILAGRDGSQAFKEAGITAEEKLGEKEGAIFTLTKGSIDRTKINELAVMMALVHLENPEYYG